MSKMFLRHIAFFRIATHRGFEIFQLMLKSHDIGLDHLLRQNLHQTAALDVVEPNHHDLRPENQITIYDCRRKLRGLQDTAMPQNAAATGNIALIDPEQCNRREVFKGGFSDFISWPVLGPELYTRLMALCRALTLSDSQHAYSRVVLVERCCCYLIENITESPSISALARMFHTNHNTLNAVFKREMGLPPSSWQRKMRLEGAARQLISTDLPVHVIAERFGYELGCNFATAFRRHFCISPLRYRRGGTLQDEALDQVSSR